MELNYKKFLEAHALIKCLARTTPIINSQLLDYSIDKKVYIKLENLQLSGSFKFRGALNFFLNIKEEFNGVIASSSGNHAKSIAYISNSFNKKSILIMPSDAPINKIKSVKKFGGDIHFYDRLKEDRDDMALQLALETNYKIVPSSNNPYIVVGAGTIAIEMFKDIPDLTHIISPIGGGGLISGLAYVAHHINSKVKVIGVVPECKKLSDFPQHINGSTNINRIVSIADGLINSNPKGLTASIINSHVDSIINISEEEIKGAMMFALLELKLVIEPSSALSLAALLYNKLPTNNYSKVGIVLTGGNVDANLLSNLLNH